MDISTPTVPPLRQRMLDDMRMRRMAEHTQDGYIRAVRKLAAFVGRSPDTATVEELRRFQLHLVDSGAGPVTINATITGLRFFFDITLGQSELMTKMQPVRVPRTLPVILSREEAARLIAGASNLKHQAAMSVAYGAGLRVSEIVSLKVSDIDSQRMTLRVQQGNRGPRQPVGQHRQWVRKIDHLVQPRAKEVRRAHPQIPLKSGHWNIVLRVCEHLTARMLHVFWHDEHHD